MEELIKNEVVVYGTTPFWWRIVASIICVLFAFIATFYLSFAFSPPSIFLYFIFLSILALGLFLPYLKYKQSDKWISVTCFVMIVWMIFLFFVTPIFTKQYYLREASKIIPLYSDAKVTKIVYLTYGAFGLGKSVNYQYLTKIPNEDYKKMHDLYLSQLAQKGYDVTNTTDTSITFQKQNATSPIVLLSISARYPGTIEVSVDQ